MPGRIASKIWMHRIAQACPKNWIKVKIPKSPTAIGLSMGPITPSPNLGTVLRLELPRERGSYGFDPGVIGGIGSNGSSGVIIAKGSV